MSEWINVYDRLPDDNAGEVLVYARYYLINIAKHEGDGRWTSRGFAMPDVTHWMPLPEPPEREG